MTINRTTLLDLPLPVTGTESGTWGDTTNNGLTQYMDIAIAGALSITGSVTLATTEGDASSTGIVSTTAQYRTLIVPASGPSANIVITAPSSNRTYHVINRNATYTVQVRAGANSGVTIGVNQSATVGYDSVAGDYVLVGPIGPTVVVASGGTGITSGTSGGVPYFSSTSTIASSGALASNAVVLGGGAGNAPATTTTGTGVVTAIGNAVNTTGGVVTQSGTLAASAVLLGGGSATAITSTTTGTGVVTAIGNAVNTTGGFVTQSGTLATSALLLGGGSATAITSTTTGTGVVTALGNNANASGGFTTIDGTATLTNKRITQRCNAQTTTASPFAWNSDSYDQQSFSALANALTINADAGTPTDGQRATFRIKDDGTARALTWTTGSSKAFRAVGVTLPTTTVINKTVYVGCIYNAADDRWDAVAVAQEA